MRKISEKIKSPTALKKLLSQRKKRLKSRSKLVFTNGCFDLLHKGHVTYLQAARKLGDLLVVALDTDESVRKIKGRDRPLNQLEDRLEVIAALESVDFVTWFGDANPLPLIRALGPDVLVKGGDWRPDQIIGGTDVLASGGKVKSLPYVKGKSTTRIIEKARG